MTPHTTRAAIPPSIPRAIARAIAVEQAKPVPMISNGIVISGGLIFDLLEEIDPPLCQKYGRGTIKRLITLAVHDAGGSVRSMPRSSGYSTYEFRAGGVA